MKRSQALAAIAPFGMLLPLCAVAVQSPMAASTAAVVESDSQTADTISSVVNLHEVAVLAQRADAHTPVAFTDVKAADLAAINTGVDIPYLLSMTPSIVATSDAGAGVGYTSVRVRGTDGSRINVTANGVPINDAESHNVYWVNLPDFASSVKDIQIQRGVGTSTNGAGAFGGSINMATETPSREPFAQFNGSYGMYNTHKETLKVGTGLIGGHWAAEARLSNIGTDGYIDRASVDMYSYFAQAGWYGGQSSVRLIAFGGKQRTYMAWDYATLDEMEQYGRRYNPCGAYTDADGNRAYYKDQYDNYTQHHFHLLVRHRFNSAWALDGALHYTKGDGYYEQYKTRRTLVEYGLQPFESVSYDDAGNAVVTVVKKVDLVRLKKMDNGFGGGLVNVTFNRGAVAAVAGAAFNVYDGDHFGQVAWVRNYVGSIDPLQEYYRNNGHKSDASAYVRANVGFAHHFNAFADLQYRHIDYRICGTSDTYDYALGAPQRLDIHRRFSFFNPKVGINYEQGAHRLFASWSVGHKEPTRDNFVDADPDRLPTSERLFDYELGYTFAHHIFSASANLYFMQYHNQLVSTGQLSDTGNAIQVNVPRSYRAGIELQFALKPVEWFDWSINATLSRNRIRDFVEYLYDDDYNHITINHGDTPICFSPSVTLNNRFAFAWRGFDAALQSHYVSRQYLSNTGERSESLDPYFVSDLVIGYTFAPLHLKSVRIGLAVNNIFNAKYFNNGYSYAGYYLDADGSPVIYRGAGYAASATANVIGSIAINF